MLGDLQRFDFVSGSTNVRKGLGSVNNIYLPKNEQKNNMKESVKNILLNASET